MDSHSLRVCAHARERRNHKTKDLDDELSDLQRSASLLRFNHILTSRATQCRTGAVVLQSTLARFVFKPARYCVKGILVDGARYYCLRFRIRVRVRIGVACIHACVIWSNEKRLRVAIVSVPRCANVICVCNVNLAAVLIVRTHCSANRVRSLADLRSDRPASCACACLYNLSEPAWSRQQRQRSLLGA